jgi:organic radical activating enzyme
MGSRLVHELHKRGISTFLVTNGQFPEELQQLSWVTQLYVSLDAPNEHDLKAPDVLWREKGCNITTPLRLLLRGDHTKM